MCFSAVYVWGYLCKLLFLARNIFWIWRDLEQARLEFSKVRTGAFRYQKLQIISHWKESCHGNILYLTLQSVLFCSSVRLTLYFPFPLWWGWALNKPADIWPDRHQLGHATCCGFVDFSVRAWWCIEMVNGVIVVVLGHSGPGMFYDKCNPRFVMMELTDFADVITSKFTDIVGLPFYKWLNLQSYCGLGLMTLRWDRHCNASFAASLVLSAYSGSFKSLNLRCGHFIGSTFIGHVSTCRTLYTPCVLAGIIGRSVVYRVSVSFPSFVLPPCYLPFFVVNWIDLCHSVVAPPRTWILRPWRWVWGKEPDQLDWMATVPQYFGTKCPGTFFRGFTLSFLASYP